MVSPKVVGNIKITGTNPLMSNHINHFDRVVWLVDDRVDDQANPCQTCDATPLINPFSGLMETRPLTRFPRVNCRSSETVL